MSATHANVASLTHVDDFIDGYCPRAHDPEQRYARWVLSLMRLPASMQADFAEWTAPHRLFCTYQGRRYRVTGASRMGDVWLSEDMEREHGYDLRVDVMGCTAWSDHA